MAEAEDPGDITSLSEFRRANREAAFTRAVDGYIVKGIPVIQQNTGQLFAYVYQTNSQGPLYKSPLEMDDETREALGLPEEVQSAVNEILSRPFSFPAALA